MCPFAGRLVSWTVFSGSVGRLVGWPVVWFAGWLVCQVVGIGLLIGQRVDRMQCKAV